MRKIVLLSLVMIWTALAASEAQARLAGTPPGGGVVIRVASAAQSDQPPPPDYEPQIQAALDAAFDAGGGTVRLAAGIYPITRPLIVRSNVHLKGDGIGATIIRGRAGALTGKTINGAEVYASISTVAADRASVSDLTVDHRTNGTNANGVSLLPDGETYEGTPSTRCVVERVQVLGAGNIHNYMIWNLRGQHIKIINNWVDGNAPTYTVVESPQEGIETFGGYDVLIAGNTVRNVGGSGIFVVSAGVAQSERVGIIVTNNNIQRSSYGVWVVTPNDPTFGALNGSHIHVKDNIIQDVWTAGICSTIVGGVVIRDLQITGNSIKNVGTDANSGSGIYFQGRPGTMTDSASVIANTISGNHIENIMGRNGFGISLIQYPNVRVLNNFVTAPGHSGIYVYGVNDTEISGNKVVNAPRFGIWANSSSARLTVKNNIISEWNTLLTGTSGIRVDGATGGVVQGNTFYQSATGANEPYPIIVNAASSAIIVANNTLLSTTGLSNPFLNNGANPNRGAFSAPAGQSAITITNSLVTPGSRVMLIQTAGAPTAFTVTPGSGGFVVTLASRPNGAERFSYDVIQ